MIPAVQDEHRAPRPEDVLAVLEALRASEEELRRASAGLKNPARYHVPGELEAYLELKHSLAETLNDVHLLRVHVSHLHELVTR